MSFFVVGFLWSISALLSHVWGLVTAQAIFVRWCIQVVHCRSSCPPVSSFNPVSSSNLHLRPSRVTGGLCIFRKSTTTTGTVTHNIRYCGWLLWQIKCLSWTRCVSVQGICGLWGSTWSVVISQRYCLVWWKCAIFKMNIGDCDARGGQVWILCWKLFFTA